MAVTHNLTEAQARQALAAMSMSDRASKRLFDRWLAGDQSARFLLHARYHGLAQYRGRGLA